MKNEELKAARKAAGLTTTEVAERLGISQPAWNHIETGNPTIGKVKEICEAMGWNLTIDIEPERIERKNEQKAIDKAEMLGYTGEDYEEAMEYIRNNDISAPEMIEADSFSGSYMNGSMYVTLPIFGKNQAWGEFDILGGKIIHDDWDADGCYYRFFWETE